LEIYNPSVNGISEKNFFVTANFYKSKIFFSGGINNNVFSMKIPVFKMHDPLLECDLFEISNKSINNFSNYFKFIFFKLINQNN